MKTVIPLSNGQTILGSSRHSQQWPTPKVWITGQRFAYESLVYQFLGKDDNGDLYARCLADSRLCVFLSSREWRAVE